MKETTRTNKEIMGLLSARAGHLSSAYAATLGRSLPFRYTALTKGPFVDDISSVGSKAPSAASDIGQRIECRGGPLVERYLHLKDERLGRGNDSGLSLRTVR